MEMNSYAVLVGSLVLALSAGGIGSIATVKSIPTWYVNVRKPSWNPPNRVFAPVWTLLYILMGTAAWFAWRQVGFQTTWVSLYLTQFALNVAWSFIFFSMHRPGWAFAEIVLMWLSILLTMVEFWRIETTAGILFIPYLAWVTFASFLNWTIWRLNPKPVQGAAARG